MDVSRLFLCLVINPEKAHPADMADNHHAIEPLQRVGEESADSRMNALLDRISQAIRDRAASNYPSRGVIATSKPQSRATVRIV
jgi:hypothetical protein